MAAGVPAHDGLVAWLSGALDCAAAADPAPGRALRLNRTEYGNAIRNPLDPNVDVSALLRELR